MVAQLEEDGKYLIAGGYANESVETRDLGIRLTRAATLLKQQAAPAPEAVVVVVAVSERPWEREGWCGKWGYCWRFDPCENGWWSYGPPVDLMNDPGDWTHMASHDAIPLPQDGEGE